MRAGPLGSLQRGVLNLRANRELILLIWLERGLVALLSMASLVPFFLVLDIDPPSDRASGEDYLVWMTQTVELFLAQLSTAPFWLAALASSALLLLVLFLASFFQAGAFAILAGGELRGGPGATLASGFRSFRWADFQREAGARLWKYFWLLNLILGLWTIWALFVALAVLASGIAFAEVGIGAGLGLGCVSVFPLAFGVVLLVFWGWLAQAEIALRDCGVWAALGSGLRTVVRRLGSMLGLFVVLAVLTVGSVIVFLLLTLTLEAGLAAFETVRSVLWWVLQALQWVVGAVIHLTFAAALVAVAREEWRGSIAGEEE